MTDDVRLELLLRDTLRASAPTHAPATLRLATLSATSHARQRRRWLAVVRARPLRLEGTLAAGSPALRLALLLALLAALAAGAIGAGAYLTRQTSRAPDVRPEFSISGSMAVARSGATATLLRDRRVLVMGGRPDLTDSHNALPSAELWDPATGTFSATGWIAAPRGGFTATLLVDGRVLVVGGGGDNGSIASAEIWDPATRGFTPTGSMTKPRDGHTATLLRDGRVLVIGGEASPGPYHGDPLASTEIWDPATGVFTPSGSLSEARYGHTATLLSDGRVLVIGGSYNGVGSPSPAGSSAEIWDPSRGTFSPAGSLWVDRSGHTSTLLPDGTVLVLGGSGETAATAPVEVWSPVDGSFAVHWPKQGELEGQLDWNTATLLPDGRVLAIASDAVGTVAVRDPVTRSFRPIGKLRTPRVTSAATLLPDGRVLIVGGITTDGTDRFLASSELIQP